MASEHHDRETFRARFGPWALVAGASDGIGESFADQLAERGLNIVLLARRESLLDRVAAGIRSRHGVETRVLVADLTAEDLDDRVARGIEGLEVGLLVYNAGAVHGASHFLDQPVEHAMTLVRLNCRGTVLLTHRMAGPMRERGRGGILLMTSMTAVSGSAYITSYSATKAFDLVLAEGLWHELGPAGVDVMAVVAGATRTPSMLSSRVTFEETPGMMLPEEVAGGALANLGRGPVWVAGETNRAAAMGMLPVSRTGLINGMSEACARLYGLPFVEMKGTDFADLD